MSFRPTITFGICVAAGIAAGIGLARPGPSGSTPAGPATVAGAEQAPAAGAGGYGAASAGGAGQQAGSAQAPPAAITIADFAFGDPITAAPGATVEVTNADAAAHTLTADGGAFDTGSISGGAVGRLVAPTEPGTYTYFCSIHPSMQGSLSVAG